MKRDFNYFDFSLIKILAESNEDYLYEGLITTYPLEKTIISLKIIGVEQENIVITKDRKYYSIRILRKDFDNIDDIIKKSETCGWYLSEVSSMGLKYTQDQIENILDNDYIFLTFKAKYDIEIYDIPDKLYHVSPTNKRDKILKKGISAKSGHKVFPHPDRLYLTYTQKDAEDLIQKLNSKLKDNTVTSYDTYEISTISLFNLQIFKDPDYKDKGYYTLNSIPNTSIKLINTTKV